MFYSNQVALITGAARRIGAALACALHQTGMNIVIHYNNSKADAIFLAQNFNQVRMDSAIILQADLRFPTQYSLILQNAYKKWGRLDILINNASSFFPTILNKTTEAQFDDLINSNFKAPFFLSQYAIPYLSATSGCIINIADINGIQPKDDYAVYCAAKAALIMLTKAFAQELAPAVRVNCIAPGPTLWPEGINALNDTAKRQIENEIPMQRLATPNDICQTALFLIQQQYLTGKIISVDGGKLI